MSLGRCLGLDGWCVANANRILSPTVTGTLKGYDQLMNLVLDNVEEVTRGMLFPSSIASILNSH